MPNSMSSAAFAKWRKDREDTHNLAIVVNNNEQLTRKRVEYLEGIVGRGFWGRLKWLLLGR